MKNLLVKCAQTSKHYLDLCHQDCLGRRMVVECIQQSFTIYKSDVFLLVQYIVTKMQEK